MERVAFSSITIAEHTPATHQQQPEETQPFEPTPDPPQYPETQPFQTCLCDDPDPDPVLHHLFCFVSATGVFPTGVFPTGKSKARNEDNDTNYNQS